MENTQVQVERLTVKALLSKDSVRQKFEELLGKRATGFITSVLQSVASNEQLKDAEPNTVFHAAAVAATLDLPINNNLGFAYIVPYKQWIEDPTNGQKRQITVAQFQMGYKGFIQLAQRSGQFQTISAAPIFKGQLVESNPLTGFRFDFTKKESDEVIGYAAYIRLLNGFEKTLYMTKEELTRHGAKFSKTFAKGRGLWKDEFDAMAQKTVIKLLLARFAPLSIEMQRAVITDQSIVNNVDATDVTYIDNVPEIAEPKTKEEIELDRVKQLLANCKTADDVQKLQLACPEMDVTMFSDRIAELGGHKE